MGHAAIPVVKIGFEPARECSVTSPQSKGNSAPRKNAEAVELADGALGLVCAGIGDAFVTVRPDGVVVPEPVPLASALRTLPLGVPFVIAWELDPSTVP